MVNHIYCVIHFTPSITNVTEHWKLDFAPAAGVPNVKWFNQQQGTVSVARGMGRFNAPAAATLVQTAYFVPNVNVFWDQFAATLANIQDPRVPYQVFGKVFQNVPGLRAYNCRDFVDLILQRLSGQVLAAPFVRTPTCSVM